MELEIYNAFVKAGVSAADATAVVESISKEIDKRYALHSQQLSTRGDLAELKTTLVSDLAELKTTLRSDLSDFKVEIMKWTIGTMFASVALFATITKLWQ